MTAEGSSRSAASGQPDPGDAAPRTASGLGPDWVPGPDGLLFRRAARVILLDEHDRVLLMRGHDVDQPDRSWWFTVGGGIAEGEASRQAAVRELAEETGISLEADDLVGPVYTRSAVFDFYAQHCRQDEDLYLAHVVSAELGALTRDGWTHVELDVLDEVRWWSLAELRDVRIEVFPAGLVDLVAALVPGWDGVTRHLGLAHEV